MMKLTPLQSNSRLNVIRVLELLSSKDEQLKYQQEVPFARVSVELFCQWSAEYIISKKWFREAYSDAELNAMAEFNKVFASVSASVRKIPPIEQFVFTPQWELLSQAASIALCTFKPHKQDT